MNKLFKSTLSLAMLISLCACGSKDNPVPLPEPIEEQTDVDSEDKVTYEKNDQGYYIIELDDFLDMCFVADIDSSNWKDYFYEELETFQLNGTEATYEAKQIKEKYLYLSGKWTSMAFNNVDYYSGSDGTSEVISVRFDHWPTDANAMRNFIVDGFPSYYSFENATLEEGEMRILYANIPEELWTVDQDGFKHLILMNGNDYLDDLGNVFLSVDFPTVMRFKAFDIMNDPSNPIGEYFAEQ